MKQRNRMYWFVVGLLVACPLWTQQVDIQQLATETQKIEQGPNKLRMLWWIPTEYWEETFKNVPNLTQQQKNMFFRTVDDYLVLIVIDANLSAFGSVISRPKEEILKNILVTLGDGTQLKPLPESKLSSDVKNLFAMMKPVFTNMLGQFGQGMEFIIFNGINAKGQRLLDPRKKEKLTVKLDTKSYVWRLPLGSLLPPKYDPKTGEKFPGNYLYNPFTGAKLITKSSKKSMESEKK